ncbi:MAG TPA: septal ring lytic transglycosylase RlpA family protein [Bacteroidota bacterium]|nr:septal ring lytic transglycosylase RlpA family protein [Bacteroidota bacterium]
MIRQAARSVPVVVGSMLLAGCIASPRFTLSKPPLNPAPPSGNFAMSEEGVASYYADEFNGRMTSSGEKYDMNQMTAAHRTLPFNTRVRVTNESSGQSVVVRINDRGPFKGDRIIDLSLAAAKAISLITTGTGMVRLEVLSLGDTTARTSP